jgi:hypothetical protein
VTNEDVDRNRRKCESTFATQAKSTIDLAARSLFKVDNDHRRHTPANDWDAT